MPKIGGAFSIPLTEQLFLRRWRTQQSAIAAPHQCETAVNQANGPVAQIVRSPVAFGNAPGAEQDLCNLAVGAAVHPRIERAQGERQSPAAMRGKRMQRLPQRAAIKGSPQSPTSVRTEFEVAIERKFDRVGNSNDWCFFQPNTVLHAVQMQYGMPTVRSLPQLGFAQFAQVQPDVRI